MPLVSKFFDADLSEAEADQLEAQLLDSPEAAERLLALAERDYRAAGLPEPAWPTAQRRGKRALIWISGAVLLASGFWWLTQEQRAPTLHAGEDQGAYAEAAAPAEEAAPAPRRARAAPESAPVRQAAAPVQRPSRAGEPTPSASDRKRFALQVTGAEADLIHIRVYDAYGACVRHIFDGPVGEGSHHLAWDGKFDDGRPAPHGRYTVEVLSPSGASRQAMKL